MSGKSGVLCGMVLKLASAMTSSATVGVASPRFVAALVLLASWTAGGLAVEAASAKINKVLPHLVDREGRHTLSPSLYERDAYQAHLRNHREEIGGLRFDVRWSVPRELAEGLRLRLELRGSGQPEVMILERPVQRPPWYDRWSSVLLDEEAFERLGRLTAWRVSLWRGPQMIAEQRSFLW
jgi:hypothetical protein